MPGDLELELKYRADGEESLRALTAIDRLGAVELGAPRPVDEVDRYLDTPSGDLSRARWACRLRTRERRTIVSLKGPAQHEPGDALHRRPEVEGPAGSGLDPAAWPDSPARDLLMRLSGGAQPLAERVALQQRRTEREARLGGRRVGTLSLDVVSVRHRDRPLGVLHLVELELAGHAEPLAGALSAELAARPGLRADPHSKLEHALALLDAVRP
jgi:inorganic triphosphatase YgiF